MKTKTRRTIELTVEHSQFFVLRKGRRFVLAWCGECAGRVPLFTLEEAARRARLSERAVYRKVEAGEIHFVETPEGALLVCLDSLARAISPLG
jgi:hypothetical protein